MPRCRRRVTIPDTCSLSLPPFLPLPASLPPSLCGGSPGTILISPELQQTKRQYRLPSWASTCPFAEQRLLDTPPQALPNVPTTGDTFSTVSSVLLALAISGPQSGSQPPLAFCHVGLPTAGSGSGQGDLLGFLSLWTSAFNETPKPLRP